MDTRRSAVVLAVLLVILIVVGYVSAFGVFPSPGQLSHLAKDSLIIEHSLVAGADTYTGVVPVKSECIGLSSGLRTAGNKPVRVTLELATVPPDLSCVSTTTSMESFSVSFKTEGAGTQATFSEVILDGASVPFEVTEK